jgi:hypothetical protein
MLHQNAGTELLYNRIVISRPGGDEPCSVGDLDSISRYGEREFSFTLPFVDDNASRYLANALLAAYATPVERFAAIEVPVSRFSRTVRQSILALDIGSVVEVTRTPLGSGSPSTLTRDCLIAGVEHVLEGNGRLIRTVFALEQSDTNGYLELNDATLGKLNTGVLAY